MALKWHALPPTINAMVPITLSSAPMPWVALFSHSSIRW